MSKASEAASQLIEEFGYDVNDLPIPVKVIAQKKFKAQITESDFSGDNDISGVLDIENENKIILVNINHSEARKNFSIAHELGHLVLHNNSGVHVDTFFRNKISGEATNKKEIEANKFAAELLMPEKLLCKVIDELDNVDISDDRKDILKILAERFGVSTISMSYRLQNLNISF